MHQTLRADYGERRDFPKIDIYWRGGYRASTTWAKTCKEAKQAFLLSHSNLNPNDIRCFFDKRTAKCKQS